MTKIVVLCDGTWNSPDIAEPTAIVKLRDALESDFSKGQLVAYFPGIGTNAEFDSKTQAFLNKWGGGAFGWGLDGKVKQAYQFLSKVTQPGDEIYLFGFSRGAYTARSVAGMIRKCGLAEDTSPEGINRAFALYRKRGVFNKPDKPHILEERQEISPRFATSDVDLDARGEGGATMVNLAYLGVFDTVGARGIPVALFGPIASLWNLQYKFHDTDLSRMVKSARHAIAVDEQRLFYAPARWDNLPTLNKGDEGPLRPYQQMWFIGNHGIVGGSTKPKALSILPMEWILAGANLALKPGKAFDMSIADPLVKSVHLPGEGGLLKRWRAGPKEGDGVHVSVMQRVKGRADYRPDTLKTHLRAWLRR